jgi:hypothetical protein
MRGSVARRLRKIASGLGLESKTDYAAGGVLRRRADHWGYDDEGKRKLLQGAPIPRPQVMTECLRRAYKEAKKIYRGLPPTALIPAEVEEKAADYRVRVAKSTKAYYDQAAQ